VLRISTHASQQLHTLNRIYSSRCTAERH